MLLGLGFRRSNDLGVRLSRVGCAGTGREHVGKDAALGIGVEATQFLLNPVDYLELRRERASL